MENIALLGADLPPDLNGDGISLRSFVECRQACRDQSGCQAFTFVKEWDLNCFLKSRRAEESEFQGAVSGTLEPCSSALEEQLAISRARRPQQGGGEEGSAQGDSKEKRVLTMFKHIKPFCIVLF